MILKLCCGGPACTARMRIEMLLILVWLAFAGCQAKEDPASFEATTTRLDSPERLAAWIDKKITYVSKYGVFSDPQGVEETFQSRRGNCADIAVFAFHVLSAHGYDPRILTIQVASDVQKNHALCAFFRSGRLYSINNGRVLGPYADYDEIAASHHPGWSEYHLYDSVESFRFTHVPSTVRKRMR